jgi:hypothetical protein
MPPKWQATPGQWPAGGAEDAVPVHGTKMHARSARAKDAGVTKMSPQRRSQRARFQRRPRRLSQPFPDAAPADAAEDRDAVAGAAVVVGEVEADGAALDLAAFDDAPVAGIEALVAVVAECEEPVIRQDDGSPCVARRVVRVRRGGVGEERALPLHHRVPGVAVGVRAPDVRLVLRLAVQVEGAASHGESVPRHAHQPLHQVDVLVVPAEHDDVPAPRRVVARQVRLGAGHARAVRRLVQHEEIAHQQRPLHGARHDGEGLDQERAHHQEDQEPDDGRLDPLPRAVGVLLLRAGVLRAGLCLAGLPAAGMLRAGVLRAGARSPVPVVRS